MFLAHPALQRLSRRLFEATRAGTEVFKQARAREFFKRRWLRKVLSHGTNPTLTMSLPRDRNLRILIDTREQALIASLSERGIPFEAVQLTEGDIVISSGQTRSKRIVIERKSIDDFYNSIRSNRLFDQIGRVFESNSKLHGSDSIFLLVLEGTLSPDATASPCVYSTTSHMYHSLLLRDRIPVIRTDSVTETTRLILSLGARISKLFSPPNDYSSLVHVERSGRKISGLNVPYLKLLMSIKGISANRAQALAHAHPSMDSLVSALRDEGGILRLAQLVCPSASRSVGTPLGVATALNVAEALLGPLHAEVSVFRLVKWLTSQSDIKNGDALRIAQEFKSLSSLNIRYLNACYSSDQSELELIPHSLQDRLCQTMDDPHVLLSGLRGVRFISPKTAELLTVHFGTVRKLHAEIMKVNGDREAIILQIRMVGTSNHKRMIARNGVENILTWLQNEGFSPHLNS